MPYIWKRIVLWIILAAGVFSLKNAGKAERTFSQIPQYMFRDNFIDPEKPVAALTFDDGPDPQVTGEILDILERYGAKATFFVAGENARVNEDIIIRQINAGCQIGNHSESHPDTEKLTEAEILAEFSEADRVLKDITGAEAKLIRPPFGKNEKRVSEITGKPVILWSLDTD